MITPLNPSLPVYVMDRGTGECIAWIDYGPEWHLLWLVAFDNGGEVWAIENTKIRFCRNPSALRDIKLGKEAYVSRKQERDETAGGS